MSKKVRLTPELEKKYREWLRAQRAAGLAYGAGDEELATQSLTDADSANIEKWTREANVAGVEFEEEEYDDDAVSAPTPPAVARPTVRFDWKMTIAILTVVALVAGAILTI